MPSDAHLRKRDVEDFCDNPSLHLTPHPQMVTAHLIFKTVIGAEVSLHKRWLPAGCGRGGTQFYLRGSP